MPTMDPNQNHEILKDQAAEMTARFRASESYQGVKGGFFGKTAILEILEQEECVGIRYYYGLDDSSNPVLIIVGVTEDKVDLVDGRLAELSITCPPTCDTSSPLV